MYEIRRVTVEEFLSNDNLDYIFGMYAKESKGVLVPQVKPDFNLYLSLENVGMLDVIAAYKGTVLVGFMVLITNTLPHYSEKATTVESQFVLKENRKYGTGKKLLDYAVQVAKDNGATVMFMSAPIGGVLNRVAESFGFTSTNIVYTRKIN